MGLGWGGTLGLRDFSILFFLLATLLGAGDVLASPSSDFRAFVKSLPAKQKEIDDQITPNLTEEKTQQLLKQVQKLKAEIEAADESFPAVMNAFIATAKTPAVSYLQKENAQVKADLATLLGTADETQSALKNDGLQFTDPGLVTQVQGYIALRASQGDPSFGIELFELLLAKSEITPRYLTCLTMERLFRGKRGVTQEAYFYLDQKFKASSMLLRQYFPLTPDFSVGHISSADEANKAYSAFMQNFLDGQNRPPSLETQKVIHSLVDRVRLSQNDLEYYRQVFFPKAAADAQMNQLLASISHVPGSVQCFQLASGVASTRQDGAVCRPAQFYSHLNRTIHTYSKIAEPGLLTHIMEYVAEYRNGLYGDISDANSKDKAWAQLKKNIGNISPVMVADNLAEGWKTARKMMTSGQDSEFFRSLVDSDLEGVQIMLKVRELLQMQGIGLRALGNGMIVPAGTTRDFTPEIDAVTELKAGFQENVIKTLNEYRLKEDSEVKSKYQTKLAEVQKVVKEPSAELTQELLNEALLETLESRMVVLDSSGRWCSVVNDTSKTEREKKQQSPWVVSARGAVDRSPVVSNTSNGFQKLEYFSTAKIANVVTIQNSDRPRKMFAGLAVRTAVSAILPNAVQARMLMQDQWGEKRDYTLDSFGLKQDEKGVMTAVDSKYTFPSYGQIIRDSREAWDDMLRRWASRNEKFSIPDNELAGLTKDERKQLIDSRFRKQYQEIYNAYLKQYQNELLAAARLAQRWDKDIKALREEPPKSAPDIFDQLGASGAREGAKDAAAGQSLVLQHMHEWIVLFRRTVYLKKTDAKYREPQMHPNQLRAIAYGMKEENDPKIDITYPEFMEEFRLNGQFLLQGDVSRWRAYMGYDSGNDIGVRPGELQEIFQLVMATREKRLEALEYARNLVLFRFPALRLNDAYKNYQSTEKDYQRVMTAYYQNAIGQAKRFLAMGALTYWDYTKQFFIPMDGEEQQAQHIIDATITNVPLLDIILKNFPDQLAFVCSEQSNRDLWEKRVDAALLTANGIGLTCSLIGLIPGAQIVGLVGLGVSAVASTTQYFRARAKWYEAEAARNFAAAAAPQLGFEADVRNWDYLAQMQKEADAAYYMAAFEAGLTVASAGLTAFSYHRAAKLATLSTGTKVTVRQVLARDLKAFASLTGKAKDTVLTKLQQTRWIAPETVDFRMRFYRAYPQLTYATDHTLVVEKAAQTFLYASDEMNNIVWRMAGMRWADSTRAIWAQRAMTGGGLYLVGRFIVNYVGEFSMARQVSYVYDDPEHNRVFLEAVEGGWMSHDQLRVALEANRDYRKNFGEKAAIYDDLLELLSEDEKEGNGSVAEAKKNMKTIRDQLADRIKSFDPDSGEAVAGRRELKFIDQMISRWGG